MKWGMQAFDTSSRAPGIGIVHQVNLNISPAACTGRMHLLSRHAGRHDTTRHDQRIGVSAGAWRIDGVRDARTTAVFLTPDVSGCI